MRFPKWLPPTVCEGSCLPTSSQILDTIRLLTNYSSSCECKVVSCGFNFPWWLIDFRFPISIILKQRLRFFHGIGFWHQLWDLNDSSQLVSCMPIVPPGKLLICSHKRVRKSNEWDKFQVCLKSAVRLYYFNLLDGKIHWLDLVVICFPANAGIFLFLMVDFCGFCS